MKSIFAVYKPQGMTSHDVVNQVRKITGVKRVGHGGTLDPLATGVLVIAVGRENTRQLSTIVKKEKEYIATIKLGEESTTDDEEGVFRQAQDKNIQPPSLEHIEKVLKRFVGNIMQKPPIYSAIKVDGRAAYKSARKGQTVEMKAREVEIKDIELVSYKYPLLRLRVITGPGVYIRSLARDIGKALNTGGYLFELERTRVGEFTIQNSVRLESLEIFLQG